MTSKFSILEDLQQYPIFHLWGSVRTTPSEYLKDSIPQFAIHPQGSKF